MLHHCTRIILDELNHYIQAKASVNQLPVSFVMLGNSAEESKHPRKIIMRLVEITAVELRSNPTEYVPKGDGFVVRKVPEAFTLYFLFSVSYRENDLLKNLELLSYVAAFFQHKSYFDSSNTPSLQPIEMENFSVELVKMSTSEKQILWNCLSIPYTPSLLYKAGLVFVEDTTIGTMDRVSAFTSFKK